MSTNHFSNGMPMRSDPFDIGRMTLRALSRLETGAAWDEVGQRVLEDSPEGQNAGNGSVMRCPPLALPYTNNRERLVTVSQQSSQITHADSRCTYGCAILNLTLAGLSGDAETPLQDALDYVAPSAPDELVAALNPIAQGKSLETVGTSGYVVHSLQTALHDGLRCDNAEEAIAGAVAGARFGGSDLPERWVSVLDEATELDTLAERLSI